jgi:hypothetical protein
MEDTNSSLAWKYEQMLHKVPHKITKVFGAICAAFM